MDAKFAFIQQLCWIVSSNQQLCWVAVEAFTVSRTSLLTVRRYRFVSATLGACRFPTEPMHQITAKCTAATAASVPKSTSLQIKSLFLIRSYVCPLPVPVCVSVSDVA